MPGPPGQFMPYHAAAPPPPPHAHAMMMPMPMPAYSYPPVPHPAAIPPGPPPPPGPGGPAQPMGPPYGMYTMPDYTSQGKNKINVLYNAIHVYKDCSLCA